MTTPSAFGLRLKEAREAAHVSQRVLSEAAGASPSVVWQIESGKNRTTSTDIAVALQRLLDVPLEWFLKGEGDPPNWDRVRAAGVALRAAHPSETHAASASAAETAA